MNTIIFTAENENGIEKEFSTKKEAEKYAKNHKNILCICKYELTETELVMIDSFAIWR